eukprot:scaffold7671_cov417-Prasinococcus_capsulatus_cf.AAC.11
MVEAALRAAFAWADQMVLAPRVTPPRTASSTFRVSLPTCSPGVQQSVCPASPSKMACARHAPRCCYCRQGARCRYWRSSRARYCQRSSRP